MKTALLILCKVLIFVIVLMSAVNYVVVGNSTPKKLQIGVKQRPAECPIKSHKGDLLHMHYTITKKKKLQKPYKEEVEVEKKKNENSNPDKKVFNLPSSTNSVLAVIITGTLEDGKEFDSSIPRGSPLTFTLGAGQVIKGWDQGLMGMCEGEHRKLVIPPELAYGEAGAPPKIPMMATLTFHVELVKIERKEEL